MNPDKKSIAQREKLSGAYDMCGLLLTSPRFNSPQVEIIREQAELIREKLEAMGVTFTGAAT